MQCTAIRVTFPDTRHLTSCSMLPWSLRKLMDDCCLLVELDLPHRTVERRVMRNSTASQLDMKTMSF